jgi:hypothetical protein
MAAELGQSAGKPWEVTEGTDGGTASYPYVNSKIPMHFEMPIQSERPTIAGGRSGHPHDGSSGFSTRIAARDGPRTVNSR